MRKSFFVIIIWALTLGTGCASIPIAELPTDRLLRDYAMFQGQGMFTWSAPGELLNTSLPKAIKQELEDRGYRCNPTACYDYESVLAEAKASYRAEREAADPEPPRAPEPLAP